MSDKHDLTMISLSLDIHRLVGLARRRRLPLYHLDAGYIVHCQLGELFGDLAPRPFAIMPGKSRFMRVLAYARQPLADLRRQAEAIAEPGVYNACDWTAAEEKRMPSEWRAGSRYGYRVRACPIQRMNADGRHYRKGAEVDVFLARCWAIGDPGTPVDRHLVYREWLAAQIERVGGARLLETKVAGFQRDRMVRRSQGRSAETATSRGPEASREVMVGQGTERKSSRLERPDAVFEGVLEVTEPEAFGALLERGIGRHRSFGFGMLLLRSR